MTSRLVYSPRAYVFTKQSNGTLLNLTPYVVSGEVQRNIGQVSSATVTLRNPDRIFTTPSKGSAFHPQDPITIYLERIAGFPVRVFTGYIDSASYYQLQPGTVTLQASCTLKRLLYTYFDPSLPYLIAFFEKYGWINTGSGSIISKTAYDASNGSTVSQSLSDGSFAKILWAILYDIGQWDDANIWIEPIPKGIVKRMETLAQSIQKQASVASDYFSQFLSSIVGTQGVGSGGGATGNGSTGAPVLSGSGNAQQAYNYFVQQGLTPAQACGIIGNWEQESNVDPTDSGGGVAQWSGSRFTALQNYAHTLGLAVDSIGAQVAFAWAEINGQIPGDDQSAVLAPLKAATTVAEAATVWCNIFEEPGQTGSAAYAYPVYLGKRIQYAQDFYNQFANSSTSRNQQSLHHGGISNHGGMSTTTASGANGQETAIQAAIQAANAINDANYPYSWGGGHPTTGQPSSGSATETGGPTVVGYDCSGSVAAVLYAAGLYTQSSVGTNLDLTNWLLNNNIIKPGKALTGNAINIYNDSTVHIFMEINGRYWGTTAGGNNANSGGGPGWLPGDAPYAHDPSYQVYHVRTNLLNNLTTYRLGLAPGSSNLPGGSGNGLASGQVSSNGSADAFVGQMDFPSIEDQVVALMLGSEGKGLMHDQSLMPFVQQVAQASLRSFQSLPNGDFFAFYPDYFGEMGHHEPYWSIHDIEILNGTISISDDALATHVYAVGDNSWPVNDELLNEMFSAGTITVFNAFQNDIVRTGKKANDPKENGLAAVMNQAEALNFIKRYGARPMVQNYPQVRSPIFEMLLAYQQFMLAWSNQFKSEFSFTFMPELYPGGKVAFPDHGLKMYIDQVTHTWDYESGFTTTAQLTAPSLYGQPNSDLPPDMVSALADPIKNDSTINTKKTGKNAQHAKTSTGPANLDGQKTTIDGMTVYRAPIR